MMMDVEMENTQETERNTEKGAKCFVLQMFQLPPQSQQGQKDGKSCESLFAIDLFISLNAIVVLQLINI